MADADIEITAGSGTKVDNRTVGTDEHRQVVVLGDPATAAAVAPVDATSGLMVSVASNSAAVRVEQSVAASLNVTAALA